MKTFVNCIPDEHFYEDSRGFHRIKNVRIIYEMLREKSEGGFQWTHKNSGYTPDGRPFYVGELTVYHEGSCITVTGAAEAPSNELTMPGVVTMALENAALRGLGMAERLYPDRQDTPGAGMSIPQSTIIGHPVNPPLGPYHDRSDRSMPEIVIEHPFDVKVSRNGSKKITFGNKYKGREYSSMISQEEVNWLKWAATKERPDTGAVEELKRRGLM